jgi:hypothetical protein
MRAILAGVEAARQGMARAQQQVAAQPPSDPQVQARCAVQVCALQLEADRFLAVVREAGQAALRVALALLMSSLVSSFAEGVFREISQRAFPASSRLLQPR